MARSRQQFFHSQAAMSDTKSYPHGWAPIVKQASLQKILALCWSVCICNVCPFIHECIAHVIRFLSPSPFLYDYTQCQGLCSIVQYIRRETVGIIWGAKCVKNPDKCFIICISSPSDIYKYGTDLFVFLPYLYMWAWYYQTLVLISVPYLYMWVIFINNT